MVAYVLYGFREHIYDSSQATRIVKINREHHTLMKDGRQFQYLSGSIHYFRVPLIYWSDRIEKAKSAGLDAIQLDIPWNFHEPEEGKYLFEDEMDIEQFVYTIHENGLLAIVRIGPYIGSDWSMGGLPAWLMRKYPNIKMRTSDKDFIYEVTKWYNVLLPKLKRHLYSMGGPIIMIQLENNYGEYKACDVNYLATLNIIVRKHLSNTVIITTNDLGTIRHLTCGSPFKELLATINFGPYQGDPDDQFSDLLKFQPEGPWIASEFHTGWMDYWGYVHYYVSPKQYTSKLMALLKYSPRINVNIHMFHGGTNFGLWNGAVRNPFATHITSYDYGAPLSEAGDTTYFYQLLRSAISKFRNISLPEPPKNSTKIIYNNVEMKLVSHILEYSYPGDRTILPVTMETARQYGGFLAYKTQFNIGAHESIRLKFKSVKDYAYIFGMRETFSQLTFYGTVARNDYSLVLNIRTKDIITDLVILVENAGYITYNNNNGKNDIKGIIGPVSANERELRNWTVLYMCLSSDPLYMCNNSISQMIQSSSLSNLLNSRNSMKTAPVQGSIFSGYLRISAKEQLGDTFVQPINFTRGILIVNDKILGHYNQALGSQLSLYLPKNYLHIGINIFVIIELDGLWINGSMYADTVGQDQICQLGFVNRTIWSSRRKRSLD
uniref:Beta-galactosidase n=1 Tax=Trichobilharzia regenti TaxID=157069 RepID=A0AA85K2S3_TRIRE|nr:unnamed protein product [Trichobilharzia regenti]